jgi:hypothetical protein
MSRLIAASSLLVLLAALSLPAITSAQADGVRRHYYSSRPASSGYRYYKTACVYGDCLCLRSIALATQARVWWDRYQACTGN